MPSWNSGEPMNLINPAERSSSNDRIELERSHLQGIDFQTLDKIASALLSALGTPFTEDQSRDLESFNSNQWDEVKHYCLLDPCDSYLAALSCLASAYRSPTIADSVLKDAARHTADFARVRTTHKLAKEFSTILG